MNIIFIQADQLAARHLQCYGYPIDSSPTLAKLAREGVRFDRCYTTFPVCLPNRGSMLTGRSPGVNGHFAGQTVLLDDDPCYAHLLKNQGYRIGGFGKFHREGTSAPHPRKLDDLGFDEFNIVEDDKRGPYLDWIKENHPDYYGMALGRLGKSKGHLDEEQEALRKQAREEVFRPLFKVSQYNHMFPSPFPAEIHDTTYITDLGLDFMKRHLAEYGETPFFCQISYVDPHDPYDPPKPYDSMFSADEMPEPLPAEWVEQGPPCLEDQNSLNCKVIREQNPGVFKKAAALYHGSVRFMDDQISRIIQFIEESGLKDNTLVVFTTDHGDLMGDHGFMAKFIHYDGSVRSPLLVWGGGTTPGVSNNLVCALDFFSTFCDAAGVDHEKLPPLEGKSFYHTCMGQPGDELWREVAIWSQNLNSVITDDGWRLTRFWEDDQGQMFNLAEDPDEQQNLYEDPEYVDKRQELLERLVKITVCPFSIPRYRNLNPAWRIPIENFPVK